MLPVLVDVALRLHALLPLKLDVSNATFHRLHVHLNREVGQLFGEVVGFVLFPFQRSFELLGQFPNLTFAQLEFRELRAVLPFGVGHHQAVLPQLVLGLLQVGVRLNDALLRPFFLGVRRVRPHFFRFLHRLVLLHLLLEDLPVHRVLELAHGPQDPPLLFHHVAFDALQFALLLLVLPHVVLDHLHSFFEFFLVGGDAIGQRHDAHRFAVAAGSARRSVHGLNLERVREAIGVEKAGGTERSFVFLKSMFRWRRSL